MCNPLSLLFLWSTNSKRYATLFSTILLCHFMLCWWTQVAGVIVSKKGKKKVGLILHWMKMKYYWMPSEKSGNRQSLQRPWVSRTRLRGNSSNSCPNIFTKSLWVFLWEHERLYRNLCQSIFVDVKIFHHRDSTSLSNQTNYLKVVRNLRQLQTERPVVRRVIISTKTSWRVLEVIVSLNMLINGDFSPLINHLSSLFSKYIIMLFLTERSITKYTPSIWQSS